MNARRLPELAAFFAPLALYLATLVPTIHLGDSGELTVAAALLGVPHVPGYPLLALLGHWFAQLPLAHIAWRGNFFSAFFGAAAVWAVYRVLLELTGRRLAALTAALTLAATYTLWEQSLKIRAYPLNTLLAAAVIYLALRWRKTGDHRLLFLGWLVLGLGLGNHEILLVTAAVPLALMIAERHRLNAAHWLICGVVAAAGVSVYLYIPVRALTDPAINWGDPSTLPRLLEALLQRQYAHKMLNPDWGAKLEMLGIIARSFVDEPGVVAALLGLAGLPLLARRDKALTIGLGVMVLLNLLLRLNYIGDEEMFQVRRYLINCYLVLMIGLAVFLTRLEDLALAERGRRWLRASLGVLCVLIVAWPALHHLPANRQQNNWVAYEAWQNALSHPETEYLLFVGGDNNLFPLWYLQLAERRRPTVTPLPRVGFRADWMVEKMARDLPSGAIAMRPEFGGGGYVDPLFLSTVANLIDRPGPPIAFVFDRLAAPADDHALASMRQGRALGQAGALTWWRTPRQGDDYAVWRFYQTAAITDRTLPRDHHTSTVATDYGVYFDRLAQSRERLGDSDGAVEAFRQAILADSRADGAMANLGNLLARQAQWEQAIFWYEQALAVAPRDWRHHHNAALIYRAAGEAEAAARHRKLADEYRAKSEESDLHPAEGQ